MIMPSFMSTILQRVDYSVTLTAWFVGVLLMIVSIIVGNCYNSLPFLVFSIFYTYLKFRESNRCQIELATKTANEIELLAQKAESERKESENSAKELRHMIANVAHDLKTVSYDSRFESISNFQLILKFFSRCRHLLMESNY